MRLSVVDLFCGCGGLAYGFQMAGFEVIFGLDSNADSVESFRANFPGATVVQKRIEDLGTIDIPDCDVIVGGPPCVNFSSSKGSRANILEGLRLVQSFLRIVHQRRPKYWLMENVPRIGLHLPTRIPLRWIGIGEDGFLDVPVRHEFDVSLYGAPQRRKRLLIGNFPVPLPTVPTTQGLPLFPEEPPTRKTLGSVIRALPNPISRPRGLEVVDPNYGLVITDWQLSDHFMNTDLSDSEAEHIKHAKTQHPYMGAMDFPDDLNKVARTVVALQMGRETLVLPSRAGKYRRATVRECASLQTFPLTFQFASRTVESRYKQAGNAVPPLLSFQIAKAVLTQEGIPVEQAPRIIAPPPFPLPQPRRKSTRPPNFRSSRVVRIPEKEVRGARVELSSRDYPRVHWDAELHLGEGRDAHRVLSFDFRSAYAMAEQSLSRAGMADGVSRLAKMIGEVNALGAFDGYRVHCELHDRKSSEYLNQIKAIFEDNFPAATFAKVDIKTHFPLKGFNKPFARLRVLVALPLVATVAALLNEGSRLAAERDSLPALDQAERQLRPTPERGSC